MNPTSLGFRSQVLGFSFAAAVPPAATAPTPKPKTSKLGFRFRVSGVSPSPLKPKTYNLIPIIALALLALPQQGLAAAASAADQASQAVLAETLLADGSTNSWTQSDLVAALQLMNRRYRRDIKTESGRRAWHGKATTQTLLTNDLGQIFMRRAYEDGFTFDDAAKAPPAAALASNVAARVRASLPTNGVSPGIAALRTASAATPAATTVTSTLSINANGKRPQLHVTHRDAYGNLTNQTLSAQ